MVYPKSRVPLEIGLIQCFPFYGESIVDGELNGIALYWSSVARENCQRCVITLLENASLIALHVNCIMNLNFLICQPSYLHKSMEGLIPELEMATSQLQFEELDCC